MQTASGIGDHIGRIEAAAQADFEHERVGRVAREGEEGGRGRDLEKGDRLHRDWRVRTPPGRASGRLRRSAAPRRGCARESAPDAARCRHARDSPEPSSMARR